MPKNKGFGDRGPLAWPRCCRLLPLLRARLLFYLATLLPLAMGLRAGAETARAFSAMWAAG